MADLRVSPGHVHRTGPSRVWLAVWVGILALRGSVLFGQIPAQNSAEELVVEVRIVGNRTVPQEKILRHIRTRQGRPLDLEMIGEDVRRLNSTRMFINVKTFTQQVPGGRKVIFEVVERSTLEDVKYVGNRKIKTKVLKKQTDLKVGDALDPFAIEEGRTKIEQFYRDRGFSKVRVTVIEGNKPGDRRAVYLINEGRKQKIFWTQFVGNTIASDSRLRTQIKSKPPFMYIFKGEVNREQIDEDVDRLTAYYRGLGFFRARVGRELDFNAEQNWLILTFVIDEGPRYVVRNVSFIGNKKFSTKELASKLSLTDSQYFNQKQMSSDVAAIQDKYGGIGYIFADVKADPRFLEEPGKLDLVYNISEGDRYRVGRINVQIKGEYPHTRITTVLNRISLKPGDIVDIRKLRASERRLRASGLFLVDPVSGTSPKIVFSPPELDEAESEVAGKPRRRPKARGQSPDPQPYSRWSPARSATGSPRERRVNLTLQGHWTDPGPPTVVRGQYTPDMGRSVPPLRPRTPVPGRVPAQSGSGWQPPVAGIPAQGETTQDYQPAPVYQPAPTSQPAPAYQHAGSGLPPQQLPVNQGIFAPDSPFFGGPPDGEPTRPLPLDVIAQETQTGRFMFGVGINSDAGLVGSIVIDEQNFDWTRVPRSWEDIRNATAFRGAGQRFRLEAVPGTLVQRYMINFQEPYLLDSNVSLGLSGYFYTRHYTEWDEERLGGRISWGYQFRPDLTGSFSFRGMKINIRDPIDPTLPELAEVVGDNSLYGFRVQMAHDTRDSAFLATEGHLVEVAFEQVTGSFDYPRGEVDLRKYFLLHERPDGSGRHVLSLSTRFGITGDDTPIYDHYYAGGFSTIRGFDFRGASPRDPATGILVGGHFQLLASAQYLFPITADDMLRAVVFCDTGTVEPTISDWSDKYRVAPGFGLRITVPAMGPAPIALDFAFPISTEPGDREEVFSFFVGFNH